MSKHARSKVFALRFGDTEMWPQGRPRITAHDCVLNWVVVQLRESTRTAWFRNWSPVSPAAEKLSSSVFTYITSDHPGSATLVSYFKIYFTGSILTMEFIYLRQGVFQLEEGYCDWQIEESDAMVISYGGVNTELKRNNIGEEDSVL